MSALEDLKHVIIQMREKSSDDYHYPVTLTEAVKDRAGKDLPTLLSEMGIKTEKEISDVLHLVGNKMSAAESSLAYLATAYLDGTYELDLSSIYQVEERILYYSEEPPALHGDNDYWMNSGDRSEIKVYSSDLHDWVKVSDNEGIFLYSCLSDSLKSKGSISITSSLSEPPKSTTVDESATGNIYIHISDPSTPYMWIGSKWLNMITEATAIGVSSLNIDTLVDLISVRYLTVVYSIATPDPSTTDIWYDSVSTSTSNGISFTVASDSLNQFIKSMMSNSGLPPRSNKLFICPTQPIQDVSYGDVWISLRSLSVSVNQSHISNEPTWVSQTTKNSVTYLSSSNLFLSSDTFSHEYWIDYLSSNPTQSTVVGLADNGNTIRNIPGNESIYQKVAIRPNTMYTYSLYVKAHTSSEPNMYFSVDGCEVVSTSLVNGSLIDDTEFIHHFITFITGPNIKSNTARLYTPSGYNYEVHSLCLQEGSNIQWSPSIKDIMPDLITSVNRHTSSSKIYRYMDSIPSSNTYDIKVASPTNIFRYEINKWVQLSISEYLGLAQAIESICDIYATSGTTTVTTSHTEPVGSQVGDLWVKDDLSVLRYTGESWGTIGGVLATQYKELSGHMYKLTESELTSTFAESSININDLVDLASSVNPEIQVFRQGSEPIPDPPTVVLHTGDLWVYGNPPTSIKRWNGSTWVSTGATRLSSIEQDASGLHITVGGTTMTLSQVGEDAQTAMTQSDEAIETADQAMEMAESARNLTVVLDNEFEAISVDYDGSGATYGFTSTAKVLYGSVDVTGQSTIVVRPSVGVYGTYDSTTSTYTVTNLTNDQGSVEFIATYLTLEASAIFKMQKVYDGNPGSSPIWIDIVSSNGNMFLYGMVVTTLTAHVYRGTDDITSQVTLFEWSKYNKDGIQDTTWTAGNTNTVYITHQDVQKKAQFRCSVTL